MYSKAKWIRETINLTFPKILICICILQFYALNFKLHYLKFLHMFPCLLHRIRRNYSKRNKANFAKLPAETDKVGITKGLPKFSYAIKIWYPPWIFPKETGNTRKICIRTVMR